MTLRTTFWAEPILNPYSLKRRQTAILLVALSGCLGRLLPFIAFFLPHEAITSECALSWVMRGFLFPAILGQAECPHIAILGWFVTGQLRVLHIQSCKILIFVRLLILLLFVLFALWFATLQATKRTTITHPAKVKNFFVRLLAASNLQTCWMVL